MNGVPRRGSFLVLCGLTLMGYISTIFFFPKDYISGPEEENRPMEVPVPDPLEYEDDNQKVKRGSSRAI